MKPVDEITAAFTGHAPVLIEVVREKHAAVALILDDSDRAADPCILFIERASHPADPWSGQMAFPGGRRDPEDADADAVARRETLEEIGIDLTPGHRIGRLDDLRGRRGGVSVGMVISCLVYHCPIDRELKPNYEVEDVARVPLSLLTDPARLTAVRRREVPHLRFPGIRIDERRVVWGLTYRFLTRFFDRLGYALPAPPE